MTGRKSLLDRARAISDKYTDDELLIGVSLLQTAYDASLDMVRSGDVELDIEGLTYDPEDPDLFSTAYDASERLLGLMCIFKAVARTRGLIPQLTPDEPED